jgi:hypothetical protein
MQQSTVSTDGYIGNYGGSLTGYYMNENNNPTEKGFAFFAGASVNSASVTAFPTLNQPLMVGGIQDASNVKLYINGILVNSQPSAAITSSGAPFGIGNDGRNYPSPGDGFWNGDYRHILVYNRALGPSELTAVNLFLNGEIPEPSTIALFVSGGFWLFLRRRADRRSASRTMM